MYACMYVFMYVWIYVCVYVWMCVCMYECVNVYMCIRMYVCFYIFNIYCMYVCMYNALDSERQKKWNVLYIGALGIAVIYVNTLIRISRKERNVLFNDALNIFYLRLYGVRHMVKATEIAREETRCRHMGYSFRVAARVLLYAPSHRQDITYHQSWSTGWNKKKLNGSYVLAMKHLLSRSP